MRQPLNKRGGGRHLEKGYVSFWCFTEGIVNVESSGMHNIDNMNITYHLAG